MKIISTAYQKNLSDGRIRVRAAMIADTLPDGFPASSAAVAAAYPGYVFDSGSTLSILDQTATDKLFMVNEAGNWQAVDGTVSYMM